MNKKIIDNIDGPEEQAAILYHYFKLNEREWPLFWQWQNTGHSMALVLQSPVPLCAVRGEAWGGTHLAKLWEGLSQQLQGVFDSDIVKYGVKVSGNVS